MLSCSYKLDSRVCLQGNGGNEDKHYAEQAVPGGHVSAVSKTLHNAYH